MIGSMMSAHHRHGTGEGRVDCHHRGILPFVFEQGTDYAHHYAHGHDRNDRLKSLQDLFYLILTIDDDLGTAVIL